MEAEGWIRGHLDPTGPIELTHERPWSRVWRVPTADGPAWFKVCGDVGAFEPRLTAELAARYPELLPVVLGVDEERRWLLLGDAGERAGALGSPPEAWLDTLPRYAELQMLEAGLSDERVAYGIPDRRLHLLPAQFEAFVARDDLPITADETRALRTTTGRFAELCGELDAFGIAASIQHDDLHQWNLFVKDGQVRILDWGDASIGHPFFSLVVPLTHIEDASVHPKIVDAYLEPWGDAAAAGDLAIRVGMVAYAIAATRQRDHLGPGAHVEFNEWLGGEIRRALAQLAG